MSTEIRATSQTVEHDGKVINIALHLDAMPPPAQTTTVRFAEPVAVLPGEWAHVSLEWPEGAPVEAMEPVTAQHNMTLEAIVTHGSLWAPLSR